MCDRVLGDENLVMLWLPSYEVDPGHTVIRQQVLFRFVDGWNDHLKWWMMNDLLP